MSGLRLTSPTGEPFTMRHGWRVGTDEPPRIGLFLFPGDATSGTVKTVFTSYDDFMDNWKVRE